MLLLRDVAECIRGGGFIHPLRVSLLPPHHLFTRFRIMSSSSSQGDFDLPPDFDLPTSGIASTVPSQAMDIDPPTTLAYEPTILKSKTPKINKFWLVEHNKLCLDLVRSQLTV